MSDTSRSPVRTIALAALVVLLAAFAIFYWKARTSERGTARDDSPAAEIGARGSQ